MAKVNESTKNVILFLGAALCIFLVVLLTLQLFDKGDEEEASSIQQNGEIKKESDVVANELLEEEAVEEDTTYYAYEIKPEFIQKGSMRISLPEVYVKGDEEEFDVYFYVKGEDMIVDEDQSKQSGNFFFRSPFSWNGNIVFHSKDITPLLVCGYSNDGRFFEILFCINAESLEESYFGQKTRFVLTDESFADLQEVAPIDMGKQERTFVFDVVLPKEFYDEND